MFLGAGQGTVAAPVPPRPQETAFALGVETWCLHPALTLVSGDTREGDRPHLEPRTDAKEAQSDLHKVGAGSLLEHSAARQQGQEG